MYIDKTTKVDFFKKLKLEHVYLGVYLQIFKTNLYRSVKLTFYRKLYRFYVISNVSINL